LLWRSAELRLTIAPLRRRRQRFVGCHAESARHRDGAKHNDPNKNAPATSSRDKTATLIHRRLPALL
jgi:hypothetical protein